MCNSSTVVLFDVDRVSSGAYLISMLDFGFGITDLADLPDLLKFAATTAAAVCLGGLLSRFF